VTWRCPGYRSSRRARWRWYGSHGRRGIPRIGLWAWGLGLQVEELGSGFGVWGFGFEVWGLGSRVQRLRFGV